MRRYWIEPQNWNGNSLTIGGDSFHHIFKVCRTEEGERFEVLGGGNQVHLVQVLSVSKKEAQVNKISTRELAPLPLPELHLCLSVPRPQILPLILEKSVELGVHSVHLFYSDRSYFKANSGAGLNWSKFNKVITQGLQQSGRSHKMALIEPVKLTEKLAEINRQAKVQCLFPFEGPSAVDLKEQILSIKKQSPDKVYFFVGSEGGFSESENRLMQEADIQPVSLGSQVLRVETACVVVTSILKYEFDLMTDRGI